MDFVIEITSPGGESRDLDDKREEYEEAGIGEYWVVDPHAEQVVVRRRRAGSFDVTAVSQGRLTSEAVAGFWIEAGWLWRRPLPTETDCLREILRER